MHEVISFCTLLFLLKKLLRVHCSNELHPFCVLFSHQLSHIDQHSIFYYFELFVRFVLLAYFAIVVHFWLWSDCVQWILWLILTSKYWVKKKFMLFWAFILLISWTVDRTVELIMMNKTRTIVLHEAVGVYEVKKSWAQGKTRFLCLHTKDSLGMQRRSLLP